MSRPRLVSLFSGTGGLDMALEAAFNAETVAVADVCKVSDDGTVGHYEPHRSPCCILAHHWPDVPNLGDVSTVDWSPWRGLVEIIAGGFPCQDVSHAGRRAGLIRDGEGKTRSGLWGQMLRAIDELRPSLVVAENVRGLLSAEADSDVEPCPWCLGDGDGQPDLRALGAVLADLADIGYDAFWYGLRAADVGAAHNRLRVFIFAFPADGAHALSGRLNGWASDAQRGAVGRAAAAGCGEVPSWMSLLPTPIRSDAKAGSVDNREAQLRSAVTMLPTPEASGTSKHAGQHPDKRRSGGHSVGLQDVVEHVLLPTPAVNDMGEGKTPDAWDAWAEAMQAKHGNGNGHGKSLSIEAQRMLPTPRAGDGTKGGPDQAGSSGDLMLPSAVAKLLPTTTVSDHKASGGNPDTTATHGTTLTDATVRNQQDWREYGPAIRRQEAMFGRPAPAPTEPGPKGNPRLSPAFSEWLMGLPDGHITNPAIWAGMKPSAARNAQLKAAGNGVVPQQAYAACMAFAYDFTKEYAA
ncbi:DNA cytosine methyltransferase [Luteipulveratus mongoliensis]|uniref:DNA (cytosine-5-)-methyltransferase n=1 Tax=Luteipulveratus mongoliensis TaxID=571913 RepID=A0A0K1JGE6_9MICO|nr:DNA cytosine methyltransferase [Luteipulveratus mongoliensis]AKU15774.1 hypothetical protein VV02_07765 [Luteipulveratus mongoliensis]